eukprot:2930872-Pyramimonas_sp.AAC.1
MPRHFRHANATREALKITSDFCRDECDAKTDPKSARQAATDIAQQPTVHRRGRQGAPRVDAEPDHQGAQHRARRILAPVHDAVR